MWCTPSASLPSSSLSSPEFLDLSKSSSKNCSPHTHSQFRTANSSILSFPESTTSVGGESLPPLPVASRSPNLVSSSEDSAPASGAGAASPKNSAQMSPNKNKQKIARTWGFRASTGLHQRTFQSALLECFLLWSVHAQPFHHERLLAS